MDDQTPSRLRDRIAVTAFVLVLTVPALAFAFGARPQNVEHRTLAAFPEVRLDGLLDPQLTTGIDRFLTDGFPLRSLAVAARGWVLVDLLGISSSGQVRLGTDGWLYLSQELEPLCLTSASGLFAILDRRADALSARDVELWLTIAPDKLTIHPEHAPEIASAPCTEATRRIVREGLAARPASSVDLWTPLLTARAAGAMDLYTPLETHWTPAGAVLAVQALVDAMAPGVWDPTQVVVAGTAEREADLTRLLGTPRTETVPRVIVERTTRTSRGGLPGLPDSIHVEQMRGDDPVVPGTTLFITDSMFASERDLIAPWFETSIWLGIDTAPAVLDALDTLPPIDRVVIESAERAAYKWDLDTILDRVLAHLG